MPIPPAVSERIVVAAEVAAALADGRPVVALESTLISHGLPYPQNLEVALAVGGRRARDRRRRAGDGRDPRRAAARRAGRRRRSRRSRPRRRVRCARPPGRRMAVALSEGGWAATTVSATMIAAHAAGIRVFATGGIGGVHRGALGGSGAARRPPIVRHLVRPRGARSHPDGGRLRRARRPSSTSPPRSSTSRPGACRSSRSARPSCPGSSPARRGSPRRTRSRTWRERPPIVGDAPRARARERRRSCACPCPRDAALPDDVARDAVERAVADAEAAGIRGPGADALAAGPHRGADRRRVDPRQHRADRQRRPAWPGSSPRVSALSCADHGIALRRRAPSTLAGTGALA